jgi:Ca2+-binding RTX toxin-like protein
MAAPVVNAATAETFTEGSTGVVAAPGLTVSDADSALLTGATVTIADARRGDYLAFVNQNGITGVYDQTTGTLTLTGSATVADYEAALRSVEFRHAADANFGGSDNTRALNWQVTDGVEVSNVDTSNILVQEGGPTAGDDVVNTPTPIDDYIDGLAGDDTLYGDAGNDYLKGGLGSDTMYGGTGNDTYVVDNNTDITNETGGDGVDTVWSSITWSLSTGLENLTLGAGGGDIDGFGNAVDNLITGNYAENMLWGLDGDDILLGLGGSDTLYGGDGADQLDGGGQNDILSGGVGDDQLTGGAGDDELDGSVGADVLHGGLGDDIYYVDADDTVVELAGQGIDTVVTDISYTLGDNVERLSLFVGDIDGTGNGLRNTILGSDGVNVIRGGGEIDTLYGRGGNDQLFGDAGNDLLYGEGDNDSLFGGDGADTLDGGAGDDVLDGGVGADKLTGGDGADVFRFASGSEMAADRILDLDFAEGDTIDLSGVFAGTIAFVGRFTGQAGQAVLSYVAGSDTTYVRIDLDGDKQFDATLLISGDHRGSETNLYTGPADVDGGWYL